MSTLCSDCFLQVCGVCIVTVVFVWLDLLTPEYLFFYCSTSLKTDQKCAPGSCRYNSLCFASLYDHMPFNVIIWSGYKCFMHTLAFRFPRWSSCRGTTALETISSKCCISFSIRWICTLCTINNNRSMLPEQCKDVLCLKPFRAGYSADRLSPDILVLHVPTLLCSSLMALFLLFSSPSSLSLCSWPRLLWDNVSHSRAV